MTIILFLLLSSFGFCHHLFFIIVLLETTVWLAVTFWVLLGNGFELLIV